MKWGFANSEKGSLHNRYLLCFAFFKDEHGLIYFGFRDIQTYNSQCMGNTAEKMYDKITNYALEEVCNIKQKFSSRSKSSQIVSHRACQAKGFLKSPVI